MTKEIKKEIGLLAAFGVQAGDLVALVGGGGKSSLLFALGRAFSGRSVLTTTTRLFQSQTELAPAAISANGLERLGEMLRLFGSCLVVGQPLGDKVSGVELDEPRRWLTRPDVDLVVVEADGSRMLPVKAPAAYEPALPLGTSLTIIVAGIDALEKPLAEVAHRPEIVCGVTGLDPADTLSPASLAALLTDVRGGFKDLPAGSRVAICLNKVESDRQMALAEETAAEVLRLAAGVRVVITALQTDRPVRALLHN